MVVIAISMSFDQKHHYNHIVTYRQIEMVELGTGCSADSIGSGKRSSAGRVIQSRRTCSMLAVDMLA